MGEHGSDIKRKINLIQELFACEPVLEAEEQIPTDACRAEKEKIMVPDQELLDFLHEREVLREQMHQDLSIASYLRCYDRICRYGLDEYFMDLLKWEINLKMGGDPDNFFSRDFELRYKDQEYLLELVKSLQE